MMAVKPYPPATPAPAGQPVRPPRTVRLVRPARQRAASSTRRSASPKCRQSGRRAVPRQAPAPGSRRHGGAISTQPTATTTRATMAPRCMRKPLTSFGTLAESWNMRLSGKFNPSRITQGAGHQHAQQQHRDVDQHQADENLVGAETGSQQRRNRRPCHAAERLLQLTSVAAARRHRSGRQQGQPRRRRVRRCNTGLRRRCSRPRPKSRPRVRSR